MKDNQSQCKQSSDANKALPCDWSNSTILNQNNIQIISRREASLEGD